MKTSLILAYVAPIAAAAALRTRSTDATDATAACYPSDFLLTGLIASGDGTNTTSPNITELSFSYVDSDTGVAGTCELNSTSTNLSPGGAYANYVCNEPLLQFSWGKIYGRESYLLTVTETVCK